MLQIELAIVSKCQRCLAYLDFIFKIEHILEYTDDNSRIDYPNVSKIQLFKITATTGCNPTQLIWTQPLTGGE